MSCSLDTLESVLQIRPMYIACRSRVVNERRLHKDSFSAAEVRCHSDELQDLADKDD